MIESYTQAGGLFIALDSQGLAVGYVKGVGIQIYPETLKSNDRPLKPPNPKVELRMKERLDYRKRRRRELKPSR